MDLSRLSSMTNTQLQNRSVNKTSASTSGNINDRLIYTKNFQPLEEDEIAQVREIFKNFDTGNRGKISIEYLPKILRLLNYNIGQVELQDLILEVDKKGLGYFSMKELVTLLSEFKFKTDS